MGWSCWPKFDHDRKRGYIVRVREDEQGGLSMDTLLEASGHLSYPYLIRHRGAKYIIPESSSAREVALYRMDEGAEIYACRHAGEGLCRFGCDGPPARRPLVDV